MRQMVLDEMKSGKTMYKVELDVLGITHANIGAGLTEKWSLLSMLGAFIGSHHAGERHVHGHLQVSSSQRYKKRATHFLRSVALPASIAYQAGLRVVWP